MAAEPRAVSGIYPSLAMFNNEGECGTGAVVPWAGRLWAITYGPHLPFGSSDKLYEITPELEQIVRPESVGGTPAGRMIHRESGQLLIGPYLIDSNRNVRVIPPRKMPGRLTGIARHLTDGSNQVYYATMEEGLYEVNVRTLEVTGQIKDGNGVKPGQSEETRPATVSSRLPGYHGKGFYMGQGRLIYANNGEQGAKALVDPTIPSGALAEWRGQGDWQLVRRNQFTEVSGPGGIFGNAQPDLDPVWSIGWDARSLILMTLDGGQWRAWRLPKASHCYDGAHGWNTEWPRIREIGEKDLLMTMHGMFWRFPATFNSARAFGIAPRSSHFKVIGYFCRWNDRVVLGCDDTAKSEFLNKRRAKGNINGPGQSQSNLQFIEPAQLDRFGPALGRGAVWLNDDVEANKPGDPFLFSGFDHRSVCLMHESDVTVTFALETDARGDGAWRELGRVEVPPHGAVWSEFKPADRGEWIRVRALQDCVQATAMFHYRNKDTRPARAAKIFDPLARPGEAASTGLVFARGDNKRTLGFAAADGDGGGFYEMDAGLNLRLSQDTNAVAWARKSFAIPTNVLSVDAASVVFIDERTNRWRLPKGEAALDGARIDREVCTERDLFNAHGTFYELPAENAGGFVKVRPVATHNRGIHDYCSWRGLLVLSGVRADARAGAHVVRSDDGRVALGLGAVDDLWQLGKPRGNGGPWADTLVRAGEASDPYLIAGYDRRRMTLSHRAAQTVRFRVEADYTGTGQWKLYREFVAAPGRPVEHEFPAAFGAYWIRVTANTGTTATAQLRYD